MPDLGTKFECAECGTKFYDLSKPDPACPKCGWDAKDAVDQKTPAIKKTAAKKTAAKKAAAKKAATKKAATKKAAADKKSEKAAAADGKDD